MTSVFYKLHPAAHHRGTSHYFGLILYCLIKIRSDAVKSVRAYTQSARRVFTLFGTVLSIQKQANIGLCLLSVLCV